jgi:transposase-like protein
MRIARLPRRRRRTNPALRAELLAAFDRSGLSATIFARRHGIHYTTFCAWRAQRGQTKAAPAFVQVELSGAPAGAGLIIELGGGARLRIESPAQIGLAAQLVQQLNAARPC